ncbi:MAG TPA: type II CAAX endopeptidase family protein [Anaerolineales bacterium]|nr:type II CAAX endopeptidase family protein [Anaerolineales bacterium]
MNNESDSLHVIRFPQIIQFFLLSFLISWFLWGLLIFFPETMGEMYFLIIFGAFGPFAAAAILTRYHQGKDETKKWRQDILRLRGRLRWHLLGGLGIPLLIAFVHIIVYAIIRGLPHLQNDPPWYWLVPAIPVNVYVVFVYSSGFGEEPGWQGYAMPRLLKIFSPIIACIIFGVLWALWHTPLYFTPLWEGNEPLYLMMLYTPPLAVILTWLTQKARGSVMPAVFLHHATNLYGSYLMGTEIFSEPLDLNFSEVKTIIYWMVALTIIWRTHGTLGFEKEQNKPVQ